MTIANGSIILAADLTALTTTALAAMQTDNAQLPGGVEFAHQWHGLVDSTSPTRRRWRFVTPADILVEAVAVQAADFTAASTTTVVITGNGALPSFPITVTGATGVGITKLARLLFDNAKTNTSKDFATTSRAVRVWPKGSTITVTVSTTSVATASSLQVLVAGRTFYSREAS